MGRGVTRDFVKARVSTTVLSRSEPEGVRDGIRFVRQLPKHASDLILECLVEDQDVKLNFFGTASDLYGDRPIYASNTSSMALDVLAGAVAGEFIGMHYCHPSDLIPLVEITRTELSSDVGVSRVAHLIETTGKTSLIVNTPVLGGVVNRLQHAMYREAYHLMDLGIVGAQEIDKAAKIALGPRMAVTGLIEQKDISGLENHHITQRRLLPDLCRSGKVSDVLNTLVCKSETGMKKGRGFYDWSQSDPTRVDTETRRVLEQILEVQRSYPSSWSELNSNTTKEKDDERA